jgi:hypothetical protein
LLYEQNRAEKSHHNRWDTKLYENADRKSEPRRSEGGHTNIFRSLDLQPRGVWGKEKEGMRRRGPLCDLGEASYAFDFLPSEESSKPSPPKKKKKLITGEW